MLSAIFFFASGDNGRPSVLVCSAEGTWFQMKGRQRVDINY